MHPIRRMLCQIFRTLLVYQNGLQYLCIEFFVRHKTKLSWGTAILHKCCGLISYDGGIPSQPQTDKQMPPQIQAHEPYLGWVFLCRDVLQNPTAFIELTLTITGSVAYIIFIFTEAQCRLIRAIREDHKLPQEKITPRTATTK